MTDHGQRRIEASLRLLREAAVRGRAVFTTSLGIEDMVLGDLIVRAKLPIEIVTLDTGRLFPETYELLERAQAAWRRPIRVLFPRHEAVEHYVRVHGINAFRDSVVERRTCCEIRKLEPLGRALDGADAWVTGLRREQSDARSRLAAIEHDASRGIDKFNPLVDWSDAELDAYVARHAVPVSPLHAQGFPSIGCAPCTRAVAPGEPARAGRWWWENEGPRECGLHLPQAAATEF